MNTNDVEPNLHNPEPETEQSAEQEVKTELLIAARIPEYESDGKMFCGTRKVLGFKEMTFTFDSNGVLYDASGKSVGCQNARESRGACIRYFIEVSLRGKILSVMDSDCNIVEL